jgi:NAD(P)-dependent dehydrogenase (short-subunit alcohol dehydrogenase family)
MQQTEIGKTMQKLAGKIAVVTGGSSGIGLAIAQRFVAEGAFVFITGRRQAELDAAVQQIGGGIRGIQGDIAKLADLDRLYAAVAEEKGSIDILCANAGGGEWVPMGAITEEHFARIFDVNVKGTLFTVQKALPLLRDGGSILMIGSIAGSKAVPSASVYNASKAAIRSFARTWIVDLKERRIRVNVLSPGPVQTPALDGLPAAAVAQLVAGVPLGRIGQPDEIAKSAVFLASGDASFITGAELFVDGGTAQV